VIAKLLELMLRQTALAVVRVVVRGLDQDLRDALVVLRLQGELQRALEALVGVLDP
jgi:hypothetical protein